MKHAASVPVPRRRWPARHIRRRIILVAGVLVLSTVPLIGSLGYFSALLLAPILSLFAVGIAVDAWSHTTPTCSSQCGWIQLRQALGHGSKELLWLVGVPPTLLLVGQLWTPNCDPWGGVLWFVVGPGLSVVMGWTSGLWGAVLGRRRISRILIGIVPFSFCFALSLGRLYVHPVVFAYDPFWGHFAGSLYDESVTVSATYGWFRAYNLLGATAAILFLISFQRARQPASSASTWRQSALALGLVAAIVTGWIGARGDDFGFTTTLDSTRDRLSLTRKTEHFVIYYAPRSATAKEIDAVAAEHEFAWSRLARILGREPSDKIHSFVFPSSGEKRRIFGAGKVEISLPWKRQIYLHHQSFPHGALHHELAHAFGATFGDPVFGLSPAVGLIEGLANALAPRASSGLDLHDQAAILDRLEKRPSLSSIIGLGFWAKASSRAYTTAGSFCAWLMETYGVPPMMELYRNGGDFRGTYKRSLRSLEDDWLLFLRVRAIAEEDIARMTQRFKRRSIFQRVCAHRATQLRRQAKLAADRGHLKESVRALETLCRIEPDRYQHRVALARQFAEAGEYDQAREVLAVASEMETLSESAWASLTELRGDLALRSSAYDDAASHYDEALARHIGERRARTLQLKRLVADDPEIAEQITRYFSPFDPDASSRSGTVARMYAAMDLSTSSSHAAVGSYLAGYQLLAAAHPGAAISLLEAAIAEVHLGQAPLPDPALHRKARLLLVQALLRDGQAERASNVLEQLAALRSVRGPEGELPMFHKSGHRLVYDQWRQRIEFFATYPEAPGRR
ncbi:MAG: hypothetical protein V3V08_24455 [Nannocystaceae bacterium]